MLRIRIAKTLFPVVAVALMGSARYKGHKTKAGKFVVLNIAQCEPRLPKVDATLPHHDPINIEEVIMADGSKYVGVLQDGKCCGEGESWDKNGHYKGQWVDNVKCWTGVFTFSNGCTYEQFANDHPNGQGKMTLPGGKVFEGEYVNGVLQGQPRTLTFPWGHYEGDTLNNQPHGFGCKVHIDGALMVGEFCEGQAFGQGKWTACNGNVVEGQFVNDEFHTGRITMKNGLVLEGTLVGGVLHGPGRLYHPGEGEFVGQFVNGMRQGPGHVTFPDGSVLEGTFVDNGLHGMTRYVKPNGDIDEVEHIHGVSQAAFAHTTKAGDVMTGTRVKLAQNPPVLENDTMLGLVTIYSMVHGPVKTIYSDGTVEVGLMKCGKPYGVFTTTHPDGKITVEDRTPRMMDKMMLLKMEQRLIYWPRMKAALTFSKPN